MSARLQVVALVGLLTGSLGARADEAKDATPHYERALAAYAMGHYAQCAVEYDKAFSLAQRPDYLFGVAKCHDLAQDAAAALARYRSYLERYPKGKDAREAKARVSELSAPAK